MGNPTPSDAEFFHCKYGSLAVTAFHTEAEAISARTIEIVNKYGTSTFLAFTRILIKQEARLETRTLLFSWMGISFPLQTSKMIFYKYYDRFQSDPSDHDFYGAFPVATTPVKSPP